MARDYVGTIDDTLNDDFGLPTGVLIGVRTSRCCTRDTTDRATIVPHRNRSSTIFWHHIAMLRGEAAVRGVPLPDLQSSKLGRSLDRRQQDRNGSGGPLRGAARVYS